MSKKAKDYCIANQRTHKFICVNRNGIFEGPKASPDLYVQTLMECQRFLNHLEESETRKGYLALVEAPFIPSKKASG
jgi:hypothetical protein